VPPAPPSPDQAGPPATVRAPQKGAASLRVIGLFKLAQATLLAAVALAALHLIRPTVAARVRDWVEDLPLDAQQDLARRTAGWLLGLPGGHAKTLAGGALLYALLFAVEGTGLLLKNRWAEWLTVVATASFIPIEIWEVAHRPGTIKVLIIIVNVAVVWLLARHLASHPTDAA